MPQKNWSIADLRDTRENISEAVNAAAFVPPACKAMLVEAIVEFDPKARLLRLDAHVHVVQTPKGMVQTWNIALSQL